MANMKTITRGQTSPHNKPKIFLAMHATDHPVLFEDVSKTVLSLSDCALMFCDPNIRDDIPVTKTELQQMQAFVAIITDSFLNEEGRIIQLLTDLAESENIPLLPILTDEALAAGYTAAFGDRQYQTAFSRKKDNNYYINRSLAQLKPFFNSIIADSKTIKRIRENFFAKVFISYRRSDQRLVSELKNWITCDKDSELSEVAYWYDEFLTPGEDFNATIMTALKKCDVFLLLMTPRMLEKGNYVLTTELPAAQQLQKIIVPVEVEAIDRTEFKRLYGNEIASTLIEVRYPENYFIRGMGGSGSGSAMGLNFPGEEGKLFTQGRLKLRDRLSELLQNKIRQEGSPEHNYLMGLAYIYGIDVVAQEYIAESYMSKAANKGYLPAIDMLADHSKNNEYWERFRLEYFKEKMRSSPNGETALKTLDAALTLYRHQRDKELYRPDQAEALFDQLLKDAKKYEKKYRIDTFAYQLEAIMVFADTARRSGKHKKAEGFCLRVLRQQEKRIRDKDPAELARFAQICLQLSLIDSLKGCGESAKKHCDLAMNSLEIIYGCDDSFYRLWLCRAYRRKGELELQNGGITRARNDFLHAKYLTELLTAASGRNNSCDIFYTELASCNIRLADVMPVNEAKELLNHTIKSTLNFGLFNVKNMYLCTEAYLLLGDIYCKTGDFEKAEKSYFSGFRQAEKLYEKSDKFPDTCKLMFSACRKITDLSGKCGNRKQELEFTEKWIKVGSVLKLKARSLLNDEESEAYSDAVLRKFSASKL